MINGEKHREGDNPAEIWEAGTMLWYKRGSLHRSNGPAFVTSDGTEAWYFEGALHRDDGPAFISGDIEKYFLFGRETTEDNYYENLINAGSVTKKSARK